MAKNLLNILFSVLVILNFSFGQCLINQEKLFTSDQLKEDLKYLKFKLEKYHPNFYLYNSKSNIDHVFDSLENAIINPLTELEFYKDISIICSLIKDGHSFILPSKELINQRFKTNKFIPYHFVILNNQLFLSMVCTDNKTIPVGSEILEINHVNATDLISQLMDRQVRDGYNLTYPMWILNNYFRQYYSFIFGNPTSFTIGYKAKEQTFTAVIKALPMDSIYFYRQKNYPHKSFSKLPNEGLKLQIEKDNKYAILTIIDFHNDVLKKVYKQKFDKVISSYFDQIHNSNTENLILDLRSNQGGDIENGVFLLSYLLDKPFSVVQSYNRLHKGKLKHCKGPSLGLHLPKSAHFNGKLYVLINGGSFSNSGIVSSCLQTNQRATFIGQETGGNASVITGFTKEIFLPNTKIQVQLPTKQFVILDTVNNTGHGVMPTQVVIAKLADILIDKDTEMKYTIDLIDNSNNK